VRQRLEAVVGWRIWLLAVAAFALFLALVLPEQAATTQAITGTSVSPDQSYWYSASELYRMAEAYGAEGRAHYIRSRFTFDVAWPLVYGSFLQATLLLASARGPLRRVPSIMLALPTLAVVLDLLENSSASLVMARFPEATPVVADLAGVFTFLKWNVLGASLALAGIAAVLGGGQRLRSWLRSRRGSAGERA